MRGAYKLNTLEKKVSPAIQSPLMVIPSPDGGYEGIFSGIIYADDEELNAAAPTQPVGCTAPNILVIGTADQRLIHNTARKARADAGVLCQ